MCQKYSKIKKHVLSMKPDNAGTLVMIHTIMVIINQVYVVIII